MSFNLNEPPGFSTVIESHESEVCYGGRRGYTQVSETAIVVGSDAEDAGNDPTTSLRGGLIMMEDSNGVYYPYGQSGKTGIIRGVLPFTLDMAINGVVAEKWTKIFTSGLLKTSEVIKAEGWPLSRNDYNILASLGFVLDEPLLGDAFARTFRTTIHVDDADYAATSYDYSSLIVVDNPVTQRTITLPEAETGAYISVFFGLGTGIVQSYEGANMVYNGSDTNDSITVSGYALIEFKVIPISVASSVFENTRWVVVGGDQSIFV